MKSAKADEIFGFASDEIKSTHPPSRRISSNEVGFHRQRRFHPPTRVDLVEKSTDKVDAFFWRRRWDSNPRTVARQLISSQSRYDHFDTSPYIQFTFVGVYLIDFSSGCPVMSCCGSRRLSSASERRRPSSAAATWATLRTYWG